ncbi:MAG: esterase family protein [Actinobacteria bacterium]|nr:esterase family protein [Actinomycetota bacterium]
MANLTVISTRFLIVLAALTAVCWWLALRRTTRRGPARRWRAIPATLLTLVLAADGVNSYFSYLPNVSDVVDQVVAQPLPHLSRPVPVTDRIRTRGELALLPVPDNGSGFGRSQAWVWLPPQYFTEPSRRLPVVYLFHGSPGVQKDWFHGGRADRIGLRLARQGLPVIEVAPAMSHGWLDDSECVDGRHERVETHLVKDVIPTVDAALRTVADRQGRIFAGMSAGGFCALNLGLRHRDLTATVLDLSGLTEPTHSGGLGQLFGAAAGDTVRQNTPSAYAATLPADPAMRLWLDAGRSDREVLGQLSRLAVQLRAARQTVQLHVRSGSHTYAVWRPALADSLTWALRQLPAERS